MHVVEYLVFFWRIWNSYCHMLQITKPFAINNVMCFALKKMVYWSAIKSNKKRKSSPQQELNPSCCLKAKNRKWNEPARTFYYKNDLVLIWNAHIVQGWENLFLKTFFLNFAIKKKVPKWYTILESSYHTDVNISKSSL